MIATRILHNLYIKLCSNIHLFPTPAKLMSHLKVLSHKHDISIHRRHNEIISYAIIDAILREQHYICYSPLLLMWILGARPLHASNVLVAKVAS